MRAAPAGRGAADRADHRALGAARAVDGAADLAPPGTAADERAHAVPAAARGEEHADVQGNRQVAEQHGGGLGTALFDALDLVDGCARVPGDLSNAQPEGLAERQRPPLRSAPDRRPVPRDVPSDRGCRSSRLPLIRRAADRWLRLSGMVLMSMTASVGAPRRNECAARCRSGRTGTGTARWASRRSAPGALRPLVLRTSAGVGGRIWPRVLASLPRRIAGTTTRCASRELPGPATAD